MRRFLRKSTVEREPLVIAMIGLRMGDRVLQIGLADSRLMSTLAAKPGLSGHAAVVVSEAQQADRVRAAAAESGLLVDVHVAPVAALPLGDGTFDVVIMHDPPSALALLDPPSRTQAAAEGHRVLRAGGRLVALEPGTATGVMAMIRRAPATDPAYEAAGGTRALLEAAGFKAVRLLADRDGYRFFEGLKT